MRQRGAETIERIDQLLADGLDAETVDELVALLRPGESAPWPELEAVLHLAEHEAVASKLRMHAVSDRLEEAIGEALEAVLPLLGIRPYGPTFKIAEIARRELEAESEKFERVSAKIEEVDADRGRTILGRYLETEPAPVFVNRMRKMFPELVESALEWEPTELEEAVDDLEGLVEILRQPDRLREGGFDELGEVIRALENPSEVATRALASDDWRRQLLGGAIAAYADLGDLAAACFRVVAAGSEAAPQLAVHAAFLAPEQTRHAASTFLAEVSWQNPELPEAELTESRIRAILSARTILPRVGSPMEAIDPESLPTLVERDDLRAIPDRIDAYWEAWRSAMENSDS